MIARGMPDEDTSYEDETVADWYPSALQPEYQGPSSPYAGFPTALEYEQPDTTYAAAEQERRDFLASQEPLLPANQLGDTLSGSASEYDAYRDVVDATVVLAITPGAGTATTDLPFSLGGVPSATFSGLSAALQQMIRDVKTPRLALCVRQVAAIGQVNAIGNPGTPPAMTTAASGGTIAAGTYLGAYTFVDAAGETAGSPLEPITTTGAASTITWTVPALPTGATSVRYYLSALGGTQLFLQGSNALTTFTLTTPPATSGVEVLPTANSTVVVVGSVFAQIITNNGDYLPLGAYPAGGVAFYPAMQVVGSSALIDLSGTLHLQTISVGVNAPVPISFQIGFSVIAIHPHSIAKKFANRQYNQ